MRAGRHNSKAAFELETMLLEEERAPARVQWLGNTLGARRRIIRTQSDHANATISIVFRGSESVDHTEMGASKPR